MTEIVAPFQQFFDTNGAPLANGAIYIGIANLDAETNPIAVFGDEALTIPAPQPIRTLNGYPVWNGAPARLYANVDSYSMTVRNAQGRIVYSVADVTSATLLSDFQAQLAAPSGSNLVGFIQAGTGAVARPSLAKMRDVFNVRDFGATGDLSQNDALAFQACVNAAGGRKIHVPVGQYRFDNPVTSNLPINLIGDGNGAGPGAAEQSNSECTQIYLNFANPTAFSVTSNKPSSFRDFQINVNPVYRAPGRGGYGIVLYAEAATTATTANSLIDNVAFNWLGTGIGLFRPNWTKISNCYFGNWANDAIFSETTTLAEGSTGFIDKNYFFGDPALTQRSCIFLKNGYTIISNNEILGTQSGIRIEIENFNAGFIRIINNTIEEQSLFGISAKTNGANNLGLLDISGNEFTSLFTPATYLSAIFLDDAPSRIWLQNVTITNNQMAFFGSTPLGFIRAAAGQNMQITGNTLQASGVTAPLGIGVVGTANNNCLASPVLVGDNTFLGTFTSRYEFGSFSGLSTLRDQSGLTFAQLPLNCRDGSMVYVTDGKSTSVGNYTLLGGGNGAMAMRQRGAWLTPGDLL